MAQTTARFPKGMLRQARIRAATDEITLQSLLIQALDRELTRRDKLQARRASRRSRRRTEASK
jgi:hypothetical protein